MFYLALPSSSLPSPPLFPPTPTQPSPPLFPPLPSTLPSHPHPFPPLSSPPLLPLLSSPSPLLPLPFSFPSPPSPSPPLPSPFPSPPLPSPLLPLPSPPLFLPLLPPLSFPFPLPSQLHAAQERCVALLRSVDHISCDGDIAEFVSAASKPDGFWPPLIVYAAPEQSEVRGWDFPFE